MKKRERPSSRASNTYLLSNNAQYVRLLYEACGRTNPEVSVVSTAMEVGAVLV